MLGSEGGLGTDQSIGMRIQGVVFAGYPSTSLVVTVRKREDSSARRGGKNAGIPYAVPGHEFGSTRTLQNGQLMAKSYQAIRSESMRWSRFEWPIAVRVALLFQRNGQGLGSQVS